MEDDDPRSLLERLRKEQETMARSFTNLLEGGMPGMMTERAKLICDHVEEFPSKLRSSILEESARGDPGTLDHRIERLVRRFFWGGQMEGIVSNRQLSEKWQGLDSDIDTDDQAEVMLRCYPGLVRALLTAPRPRYIYFPLLLFTLSPGAVHFIPLVTKWQTEGFLKDKIPPRMRYRTFGPPFKQLLCNEIVQTEFGKPSSPDLDEKSLVAFQRILDEQTGTMDYYELRDNIFDAFDHFLAVALENRESPYIERRLRLLVHYDSTLLDGSKLLLALFKNAEEGSQCYEKLFGAALVLFELGLFHYPLELGFFFHQHLIRSSYYEKVCINLGKEATEGRIKDTLLAAIGKTKDKSITMNDMLIAAAMNSHITLDGVYLLLRCNPIMASKCNNTRSGSAAGLPSNTTKESSTLNHNANVPYRTYQNILRDRSVPRCGAKAVRLW